MVKLRHSYSALKTFDNCPKRYYHERIAKDVRDLGGEASIYGTRIHEQMEARLKDGTPLPSESARHEKLCAEFATMGDKVLAEQEMTLTRDLKPTGWWDDDAWLRSKLDVLVLGRSTAVVADWKTGKHRPDFDQLEMFALQTFAHYPEVDTVYAAFIWLLVSKFDRKTYHRDQVPAMWEKVFARVGLVERAQRLNLWPAKPSRLCGWCPAKNICEYAER